jgi:hypothetical protein
MGRPLPGHASRVVAIAIEHNVAGLRQVSSGKIGKSQISLGYRQAPPSSK